MRRESARPRRRERLYLRREPNSVRVMLDPSDRPIERTTESIAASLRFS